MSARSNDSNNQVKTVKVVVQDESIMFAVVTLIFYLVLYPVGLVLNIVGLFTGPRRGCFVTMLLVFVLLVPLIVLIILAGTGVVMLNI